MSESLVCWNCGHSAAEHPMPMSTYAECSSCQAQLHVCRMCRQWNPKFQTGCDETRAGDVSARETINFCEWFVPISGALHERNQTKMAQSVQIQLDELFSKASIVTDTVSIEDRTRQELKDLFNKIPGEVDGENPAGSDHKDG